MRLAVLISCIPAVALAGVPRDWQETQATGTRAAPALATDGMALSDVVAYGIRVCAVSGNLTGVGSLRAYVRHEVTGAWMRLPALDVAMPAESAGKPCVALPDLENALPRGRILYAADGLGAGVRVYIEAWAR